MDFSHWLFANVCFYAADTIMQPIFMHWSTHYSAWRRHILKMQLLLKSMLSRCNFV